MSDSLKKRISKSLANFRFFQIYIETEIGDSFDDMLTKDEVKNLDKKKIIQVYNNESAVTLENWNAKKDIFFKQRMEKLKDSYTINEKIKVELEDLNNLPILNADYKTLADRYKAFLVNKTAQKAENEKTNEVKNNAFILTENNFDEVEPTKVVKYFKILVENGFITQSNFDLFIKNVFYKNQIVSTKINIEKLNVKTRVKKIFYKYYDTIQPEKYNNQEKYLRLLTDNFVGFNYNSLKPNFSK